MAIETGWNPPYELLVAADRIYQHLTAYDLGKSKERFFLWIRTIRNNKAKLAFFYHN
jgi:hypothetical protein